MVKNIVLVVNFLLVVGLGIFVLTSKGDKKAYIINQEVFNGFVGKQELEKKLSTLKTDHKTWLDSVELLIQQSKNENLIRLYQENETNFKLAERQLSEQYTADIWKSINLYIAEFGKEEDYDFIFGASGDGSLMYASDANNVTGEVISFINEHYKKGE